MSTWVTSVRPLPSIDAGTGTSTVAAPAGAVPTPARTHPTSATTNPARVRPPTLTTRAIMHAEGAARTPPLPVRQALLGRQPMVIVE